MNILKVVQGWLKLKGGTDGTIIGNTGDALKTTVSEMPPLTLDDTPAFDSFHALRVSEKKPIIDLMSNYGKESLYSFKQLVGGTYLWNSTRKYHELDVTSSSGSLSIMQSRKHGFYSAGQSSMLFQTAYYPVGYANQEIRVGWFDTWNTTTYDDYEGIYFKKVNKDWYVCVDSRDANITDTVVHRDNWLDPLDGTGASGLDLGDMEDMPLITAIDLQYLGIGRIRFMVEGRADNGDYGPIVVHEVAFNNSTDFDSAYLTMPAKPLRWEIRNTGASTANQFRPICGAYFTEGGGKITTRRRATPQAIYDADVDKTWKPIIVARVKSEFRPATCLMEKISALITTTSDFAEWRLCITTPSDITFDGTPTWTALPHSIMETTSDVISIDDCNVLEHAMCSTASVSTNLSIGNMGEQLGWDIDGNQDIYVIEARGFQDNTDMYFSASWEELL